jgi:hypothetical protein
MGKIREYTAFVIALTGLMIATPPVVEAIKPWIQSRNLATPPIEVPRDRLNATTVIGIFSQGDIKVTLITSQDGKQLYIGQHFSKRETIYMKQNPDGKFTNANHVYQIISKTEKELIVEVTYPQTSKKHSKIVKLKRQ